MSISVRVLALVLLSFFSSTWANEAVIRKTISERLPDFPKIDEIRSTPIAGLFELRVGSNIFYSDAKGEYILQDAQMVELRTRRNLTEARIEQINQIEFSSLPLKDAIVWKRGSGERKLAVFADPNCGYCKRLERTMQELKDVTVYTFLLPILGPDSQVKSKAIWCAKDSSSTWLDWMLRNKQPQAVGNCDDSALQRNREFASKHGIHGTPAILFQDGSRAPGALELAAIEGRLKRAEAKN